MSKYFVHLKLPFDAEAESLARFETNLRMRGHVHREIGQVDARLIELLAAASIKISHAESFYTPPQGQLNIHIDSSRESDLVKLNFCYGAEGSVMNWWALKNPAFEPTVAVTEIGTNYLYFPREHCKLIASTKIRRPTLVNAGRPHSVLNPTNEGRWVLSMVLDCAIEDRHLTLAEAADRLEKFKA